MERYFYGITVDYFLDDSICVLLFPTLTCGVLFLVLYPLLLLLLLPPVHKSSLTHISLTHTSHNHTQPHSHTQAITHSLTHTHTSLTLHIHHAPQLHTPHSTPITHTTHSSLTPLHSTPLHSHYHSHAHIPDTITRTHITHITLPVAFAWQVRRLVLCERSDGVAGASRWLLHAAPLGALQGVGCTPWRPLLSAALPVAFAWQVRHCAALGALQAVGCIRPGVPWCRLQVVGWRGRCGTWCSASGRMYALASLGALQKPPAERRRPREARACI